MRSITLVVFTAWCAIAPAPIAQQAPASAQDTPAQAPTKTPSAPTPAQIDTLKAGVRLHDQGKYDDAIALYQKVLDENPDCVVALFEMSNSYHAKKEYTKSMEVATRGTAYVSPQLADFYMEIGTNFDEMNEPAKAVDTYKRGIAIAPTALLYYNLAVTLHRLNQDDEALVNLKQAARVNPAHASSQLEIGKAFLRAGYVSQGVLALSRFLILEPTSPRTADALRAWMTALQGNIKVGADGKINLGVKPAPDTAEGDFTQLDLLIGISGSAGLVKSQGKMQAQVLVDQLDGWFRMIDADKTTDRSAFAWSYYAPFFVEMHKRGYVEPFVYWVCQRSDFPGVKEWVADPANRQRATEFINWSRTWAWSQR